jgi:hypothetical protein
MLLRITEIKNRSPKFCSIPGELIGYGERPADIAARWILR